MRYLAILFALLTLSACATVPMGQRNVGAAVPFIVRHPNQINNGLPLGYYVGGYYDGNSINVSSGVPDYVSVHEFAHMADHLRSYDKALDAITPKLHIQPDFQKVLDLIKSCIHEARGLGPDNDTLNLWRVIHRRWGDYGVNHSDILERIK